MRATRALPESGTNQGRSGRDPGADRGRPRHRAGAGGGTPVRASARETEREGGPGVEGAPGAMAGASAAVSASWGGKRRGSGAHGGS